MKFICIIFGSVLFLIIKVIYKYIKGPEDVKWVPYIFPKKGLVAEQPKEEV